MKTRTLRALKSSRYKWKKIWQGKGADEGCDNCALCKLFNNNYECSGCPVAIDTESHGCCGTLYPVWREHLDSAHGNEDIINKEWIDPDCDECKAITQGMYLYLDYLVRKAEK